MRKISVSVVIIMLCLLSCLWGCKKTDGPDMEGLAKWSSFELIQGDDTDIKVTRDPNGDGYIYGSIGDKKADGALIDSRDLSRLDAIVTPDLVSCEQNADAVIKVTFENTPVREIGITSDISGKIADIVLRYMN